MPVRRGRTVPLAILMVAGSIPLGLFLRNPRLDLLLALLSGGGAVFAVSVLLRRRFESERARLLAEAERSHNARRQTENERDEHESRYHRLATLMPEAVVIHTNGVIRWVNPSTARLLGVDDPETLEGRGVMEFVHPQDAERIRRRIERGLRSESPVPPDEWTLVRADGTEIRVKSTGTRLEYRGEPAMLTLVRDIEEHKRSEDRLREVAHQLEQRNRELERARDEAQRATDLKSQFLANVSHEIRTPMNAVLGMIQLLDETELGEDQREYLAVAETAAERLLRLIEDILDLSKVEAGKLEIEQTEVDLEQIVGEALATQRIPVQQKGIELRTIWAPGACRRGIGDPYRIRQVLVNLVANAVKFTPAGSVTVEVDAQDGRLRVAVRDTGIGIEPRARELIFEAFTQADGTSTRRYGGTGLGLAISRQLVGLMGGTIDFESVPGEGSCFFFELPWQALEDPADDTTSVAPDTVRAD